MRCQVPKDSLLLFFLCVIHARSFGKTILHKIMKTDHCKSSACVVAWDDMALEMQEKKVHPKNGIFLGQAAGGAAQVEVPRHTHHHQ
jgi:hypothetical protein